MLPKSQALSFTFALHTYFAVADIATTRVHGLQGVTFQDHLKAMREEREERLSIHFESEVDRTYMNVPRELAISVADAPLVRLRTSAPLVDAVVWSKRSRLRALASGADSLFCDRSLDRKVEQDGGLWCS